MNRSYLLKAYCLPVGGGSLLAKAPYMEANKASSLALGMDKSGSTWFNPFSRKASITFQTSSKAKPVFCWSNLSLAAKRYEENLEITIWNNK